MGWGVILLALAGCQGNSAARGDARPAAAEQAGVVVWFFVLHDCPISNAYAPEIERIHRDYAGRGVASRVVYVDEEVDQQAIEKHAREYGITCPILIDRDKSHVRRLGAKVTPQAVVMAPDGQLKYSGRIDDLYADLGKKRIAATSRDLRSALDAVLAGKAVANAHVPAVGCTIQQ
jgi:hypothetical protein